MDQRARNVIHWVVENVAAGSPEICARLVRATYHFAPWDPHEVALVADAWIDELLDNGRAHEVFARIMESGS